MERELVVTFESVGSRFYENELAYLALTTKIELPIRDKWAFSLHSKLINSDIIVSREWKRTDIAILNNAHPLVLIELKAMYTFDAALHPSGINGYAAAMLKDEKKARSLGGNRADIFTVLLATHPSDSVPSQYNGIVKYHKGINDAIRDLGDQQSIKNEASSNVEQNLEGKNIISKGEFSGGRAFGINVSILFWMVKA